MGIDMSTTSNVSGNESAQLKARDQRIIWTLIQVGEDCPTTGRPRADLHQINNLCADKPWGKIPSTSLHRAVERLVEKGWVKKDKRPQEEWDKNDKPPVVITMTDLGMERVGQGGIKAAMVDDPTTLSDPTRFGDLQSQIGGIKGHLRQVENDLRDEIDEVEDINKESYGKACDRLDALEEDIERVRVNANKATNNTREIQRVNSELDDLRETVSALNSTVDSWQTSMDDGLANVTGRVDSLSSEIESLRATVEAQESVDSVLGARLSHIEMFLSQKHSGGFRSEGFLPWDSLTDEQRAERWSEINGQ